MGLRPERIHLVHLSTGAELRVTGPTDVAAVVCVNGGQRALVEGTWSASLEWLVRRLAPQFPALAFAEVRYRIKSWNRFEWCVDDARAAIRETAAPRTLVLGFSMGGGVAIAAADEPGVEAVVGLAPWIPKQVDLTRLRGRRLAVLHGSFDRPLLGIPGVTPASSRRAFDRARALGIEGDYTRIPAASHGIAMRASSGRVVALPRARAWERGVARELERFERSRSIEG